MKLINDDFSRLKYLRINPGAEQTIVLLHGYGANAFDLSSLAQIDAQNYTWIFVQAPLSPPELGGIGFSWFELRLSQLDEWMRDPQFKDIVSWAPPELSERSEQLLKLFQSLGLNPKETHVGGFSQGAMLATEVALNSGFSPKSLSVFSGAYINKSAWKRGKLELKKVFQSHGEQDPVLPFKLAEKLQNSIFHSIESSKWQPFQGGHEIPRQVLKSWAEFLG